MTGCDVCGRSERNGQAGGGGAVDADDLTSIASSGCPPAACTASQGQAALRFPEVRVPPSLRPTCVCC